MSDNKYRSNILNGLFKELSDSNCVFYVLRYHDVKNNTGDVDILCNETYINFYLKITELYFKSVGFIDINTRSYGFHFHKSYINSEGLVFLIDFQGGLEKDGMRFFEGKYFLENSLSNFQYSDSYILSPELELVLLTYHCVFDKKSFKEGHLKAIKNLCKMVKYDKLIDIVSIDFSQENTKLIVGHICNHVEINSLISSRSKLLLASSTLINYSYGKVVLYLYRAAKVINPKGFLVVFIGVDGSGKTLYSKKIGDIFSEYQGFSRFHLNKDSEVEETLIDPRVRTKSIRFFLKKSKTILKLYMFLDQYVKFFRKGLYGYLRGDILIFDRYIYDSLVLDIRSDKISFFDKLLLWLTLRPDIVFFIHANDESIFKRKGDNSLNEINRQQRLFGQISNYENFVNIDTEKGVEKTIQTIERHILKKLEKKSKNTEVVFFKK